MHCTLFSHIPEATTHKILVSKSASSVVATKHVSRYSQMSLTMENWLRSTALDLKFLVAIVFGFKCRNFVYFLGLSLLFNISLMILQILKKFSISVCVLIFVLVWAALFS